MDDVKKFYIGRVFDQKTGKTSENALLYEPDDLNTHGIVVGMTGSGKTGLCIGLLEEAALKNVPALMIDPKGDITNTLLHFPELLPDDFQPWINPDEARRSGKSLEDAARETAELWANGLENWGIKPERIQTLKDSAQFTIFTPGSDAGIPISILASLEAPAISWQEHREMLREKISSTVTSLLGLVGMSDIDPVRSREHILLSNIFEYAWSNGTSLSLGELIMQVQNPPFDKLGVFDINTFFPEKDRFELAMLLNNILAAPSFQSWIEGEPLDIQRLLYTPEGKPRHSIFYISHLNDAERMFFVTLLFSAIETWMRSQAGTTSLRALVYFDEIFGYLPPARNPASKGPMLRMLKQARAFGVGLLLATQNPVDIDYKALSNTGSWFIGKLQTDQDKQRLLDGLQGAAPGVNRNVYDKLLSGLGKRVFLMHNVHEKMPVLFQTRWVMNYLAGPLTRSQIPALNALASSARLPDESATTQTRDADSQQAVIGDEPVDSVVSESSTQFTELPGVESHPSVPARVQEYFLPNNLTISQAYRRMNMEMPADVENLGLLYRPALLGQVVVRYLNRKYNLDTEIKHTVLVESPDRRGFVRWEEYEKAAIQLDLLENKASTQARFIPLEAPLNDAAVLKTLSQDFEEWIYRTKDVKVQANDQLKVYAGPDVSSAEFRKLCAEAAKEQRDAEIAKAEASFEKKLDSIETKLSREERELVEDESEYNQRKMEEMGTHVETVMRLFSSRRKSLSSSMSKRRMTEKAKADVDESKEAIKEYKQQIDDLQREIASALDEINDKWGEVAANVEEISVTPTKTNIHLELFGVAWAPMHLLKTPTGVVELPGFG